MSLLCYMKYREFGLRRFELIHLIIMDDLCVCVCVKWELIGVHRLMGTDEWFCGPTSHDVV